jgi:hypothetical protein
MFAIVQSIRDLREFLAAKRRKREPIQWAARGAATATYVPKSARGFANFRTSLRGVGDWGRASERVDALADALRRRHGCDLPLPRKVIQNSDRSLTLFWESLTVRAFPNELGVTHRIGATGDPVRGVTTDLLDMLGFQAKVSRA